MYHACQFPTTQKRVTQDASGDIVEVSSSAASQLPSSRRPTPRHHPYSAAADVNGNPDQYTDTDSSDEDDDDEEDGESLSSLPVKKGLPSSYASSVVVSVGISPGAPSSSNNSKKVSKSHYAYTQEQLLNMNSRSPEWMKIPKSEKEKLGLTFEDDGEFWLACNEHLNKTSH